MALPDNPLTRVEEYLNNIATGEGAIPDVPYTRIEQYLDYIAKNGGSGGGGAVTSVNGQTGTVVIPLAKPGNTHVNVFNPNDSNVTMGYIANEGQINNSDTYWTTGFIPAAAGSVIRVFYGGANKVMAYIAEYTSAQQSGFVSRTANGSYNSYTTAGDGYIRISIKTSAIAWADRTTTMVTINDANATYIAYGALDENAGLMSAADKRKLDGLDHVVVKQKYGKYAYIAYSSFDSAPPNSVPHYEWCAANDYDWIKADIQPTSDGGLVCCHDNGFTFDGNGRITTYNSGNATLIHTLTLAQATALQYASQYNGQYVNVADIDDFLAVCKKYGKVPYITIRDEYIADEVAPALMAALDRHTMREVAVINSSNRTSLSAIRSLDSAIPLSLFFNPFGSSMASGYQYCLDDGNCIAVYFYTQSSHTWSEFISDSTVAGYIQDCQDHGIPMVAAIESDDSHTDALISMGFSGCHTMQTRLAPSSSGLPSSTSSDEGKFLVVDSSGNPVWTTLTAWQGGNF